MGQDIKDFSIPEDELASILNIKPVKLFNAIKFFDSNPHDEWDLTEGVHFIFLNKTNQENSPRMFSELGAYAIAAYLDATEPQSIMDKIKEFFTHHKKKIRRAQVIKKIHSQTFPIIRHNNSLFITKKSAISILCTNYPKLKQTFEHFKTHIPEGFKDPKPLKPDEEYIELPKGQVAYYSVGALRKISEHLGETLTKKDRCGWCQDVSEVCISEFRKLDNDDKKRSSRIASAKKKAKRRDKYTCQITGLKKNEPDTRPSHSDEIYRGDVVAHHIYCQKAYPHLADNKDNLITLAEPVHDTFHQIMGGTNQSCTIDDLIDFVTHYYPDFSSNLLSKLHDIKRRLGPQSPSQPRFLYLKAAEDTEKS